MPCTVTHRCKNAICLGSRFISIVTPNMRTLSHLVLVVMTRRVMCGVDAVAVENVTLRERMWEREAEGGRFGSMVRGDC